MIGEDASWLRNSGQHIVDPPVFAKCGTLRSPPFVRFDGQPEPLDRNRVRDHLAEHRGSSSLTYGTRSVASVDRHRPRPGTRDARRRDRDRDRLALPPPSIPHRPQRLGASSSSRLAADSSSRRAEIAPPSRLDRRRWCHHGGASLIDRARSETYVPLHQRRMSSLSTAALFAASRLTAPAIVKAAVADVAPG